MRLISLLVAIWGLIGACTSHAAISLIPLDEVPDYTAHFSKPIKEQQVNSVGRFDIARGEGQLLPISVEGTLEGKIKVEIVLQSALGSELYALAQIDVGLRVGATSKYDFAKPVNMDEHVNCKRRCLLLLRVVSSNQTPFGMYEGSLLVSTTNEKSKLPLMIAVQGATINFNEPLIVQAATGKLGPITGDPTGNAYLKLYSLLSEFGVNKFAIGDRNLINNSLYHSLVNLGMVGGRIGTPDGKRFFKMNTQSEESIQNYITSKSMQVWKYSSIVNKYPYMFHVKIWDEPVTNEVAFVGSLYRQMKKLNLPIKYEIAGLRELKGFSAADIHVRRLQDIKSISETNQENEIWLYANSMHSLRNPTHTMKNIGSLIWYFGLDGYHFWNVTECAERDLSRVLGKQCRYGRGQMVYWDKAQNTFFPSLRLLMFREGIEDYYLLSAAANKCGRSAVNDWLAKKIKFTPGKKRYTNLFIPIRSVTEINSICQSR